MSSALHLVSSGIPPVDARLGGAVVGRVHLLSGGPGAGKTTACLQFVREGLRRGEAVAMLTADRPSDLRSHAAHLALDLATPLRDGRLSLLRYSYGMEALLQCSPSPDRMLDDLRRMLLSVGPARLVIDTVAPLLSSGPHAAAVVAALTNLLESSGIAALVTCSGDLTGTRGVGYDHRIEPLAERAAAVLHLTRRAVASTRRAAAEPAPPTYQLDLVQVRFPVASTAPVPCTIEPGAGLALVAPRRASSRPRRSAAVRAQPAEPSPDSPKGLARLPSPSDAPELRALMTAPRTSSPPC